jgi:hypothetical protein
MTTAFFILIVLALVGYGLERNHARRVEPHGRLAGSYDIDDRDLSRVGADLRVAVDHQPAPAARHRVVRLHRNAGVQV